MWLSRLVVNEPILGLIGVLHKLNPMSRLMFRVWGLILHYQSVVSSLYLLNVGMGIGTIYALRWLMQLHILRLWLSPKLFRINTCA